MFGTRAKALRGEDVFSSKVMTPFKMQKIKNGKGRI